MIGMWRTTKRLALVALAAQLVGLMASCAQVRVTTRLEPGIELDGLESYVQAPPSGRNQVVVERIQSEIAKVMDAKGYRQTQWSEADMVIAFRGGREARSRRREAGDPDAAYYVIQEYEEGTLVIDVIDVRHTRLAWHGVGHVDIFEEEDVPEAAARAVRAVLAEFPATQ